MASIQYIANFRVGAQPNNRKFIFLKFTKKNTHTDTAGGGEKSLSTVSILLFVYTHGKQAAVIY